MDNCHMLTYKNALNQYIELIFSYGKVVFFEQVKYLHLFIFRHFLKLFGYLEYKDTFLQV